jgi:acetyl-CoA synthetase
MVYQCKVNIVKNCIDRHLAKKEETAIILNQMIQMEALHRIMNCTNVFAKMANVLKEQGIQKEIVFMLPMIPECLITTLACARIGAIHSVVLQDFPLRQ